MLAYVFQDCIDVSQQGRDTFLAIEKDFPSSQSHSFAYKMSCFIFDYYSCGKILLLVKSQSHSSTILPLAKEMHSRMEFPSMRDPSRM
jgi:hypothetical protein